MGLDSPADLVLGELPVPRRRVSIAGLTIIVVLLSAGTPVGMASTVGFSPVLHKLEQFEPLWLAGLIPSVGFAFFGYELAFDRVIWGDEARGLNMRVGVVAAGFGAFVHRGGTAIDRYVMRVHRAHQT